MTSDHPFRKVKKGKAKAAPKKSDGLFEAMCKAHGLPIPDAEYLFAEDIGRKWRFDWLFEGWLALEIQGGLFIQGRHNQGAAMLKEHEKLNEAAMRGYVVLFTTPADVKSGAVFALLKRALLTKEEQP